MSTALLSQPWENLFGGNKTPRETGSATKFTATSLRHPNRLGGEGLRTDRAHPPNPFKPRATAAENFSTRALRCRKKKTEWGSIGSSKTRKHRRECTSDSWVEVEEVHSIGDTSTEERSGYVTSAIESLRTKHASPVNSRFVLRAVATLPRGVTRKTTTREPSTSPSFPVSSSSLLLRLAFYQEQPVRFLYASLVAAYGIPPAAQGLHPFTGGHRLCFCCRGIVFDARSLNTTRSCHPQKRVRPFLQHRSLRSYFLAIHRDVKRPRRPLFLVVVAVAWFPTRPPGRRWRWYSLGHRGIVRCPRENPYSFSLLLRWCRRHRARDQESARNTREGK